MSDIQVGSEWVNKNNGSTIKVVGINCAQVSFYDVCDKHETLGVMNKSHLLLNYDLDDFYTDRKEDAPKAVQILNEAVLIMAERGKSYDKSGGEAERSMPKIVAMFNALTGHDLTPEQGWKFMCCLKLARSEQGEYREDNYLDGAAYMALAGEEAEASNE